MLESKIYGKYNVEVLPKEKGKIIFSPAFNLITGKIEEYTEEHNKRNVSLENLQSLIFETIENNPEIIKNLNINSYNWIKILKYYIKIGKFSKIYCKYIMINFRKFSNFKISEKDLDQLNSEELKEIFQYDNDFTFTFCYLARNSDKIIFQQVFYLVVKYKCYSCLNKIFTNYKCSKLYDDILNQAIYGNDDIIRRTLFNIEYHDFGIIKQKIISSKFENLYPIYCFLTNDFAAIEKENNFFNLFTRDMTLVEEFYSIFKKFFENDIPKNSNFYIILSIIIKRDITENTIFILKNLDNENFLDKISSCKVEPIINLLNFYPRIN